MKELQGHLAESWLPTILSLECSEVIPKDVPPRCEFLRVSLDYQEPQLMVDCLRSGKIKERWISCACVRAVLEFCFHFPLKGLIIC